MLLYYKYRTVNKTISIVCLIVWMLCGDKISAKPLSFKFLNSTINLLDSAEAGSVLVKRDAYTHQMSTFDVASRLKDPGKKDEDDYLLYAEQQALNWPDADQQKIKTLFKQIEDSLEKKKMSIRIPPVVNIIKTTGKEEYNAEGYTRGNNIILTVGREALNLGLVAHELFHVYSRFYELERNTIYLSIGFRRCDAVPLKDAFHNRNITNPDCPYIGHFINVNKEQLAIVLYSKSDYTKGDVFQDYLQLGLLVLEGSGNHKTPKMVNGEPVVHTFEEVPDIYKQIGRNTDYVLHPEEILATNFSAIITNKKVKDQMYLERMWLALRK